jgi:hypothetical protein
MRSKDIAVICRYLLAIVFCTALIALPVRLEGSDNRKRYSPSDHGRRQLEQMLADIPAMGLHPETGEPVLDNELRSLLVDLFAGEGSGVLTFWDSALPPEPFDAFHRIPTSRRPAAIRIRRNSLSTREPFTFDELWSSAVYELFNVGGWRDFHRACHAAAKGSIDRKDFIRAIARREFLAHRERSAFFEEFWRPWARKKELKPDTRVWLQGNGITFDQQFDRLVKKQDGPYWQFLASMFDEYTAWGASLTFPRDEARSRAFFQPSPNEEILRTEWNRLEKERLLRLIDSAIER